MPGPPGVIRVEEIGNTWVKLRWTKGADHNSPILYYTIQTRHYWALNEDDWRNASTCKGCFVPAGGDISPQFSWSPHDSKYQRFKHRLIGFVPIQLQLFSTAAWRGQK